MKRILLVILLIYVAGYAALRVTRAEVWEQDGQSYVIFPENMIVLYYAFRPLSYLDAMLTGMGAHIGPHQ